MGNLYWVYLVLPFCFGLVLNTLSQENSDSDVYIVTLKQAPLSHSYQGFNNDSTSKALKGEKYRKLYSYRYLINGFSVLITPQQADMLSRRQEVANVVLDFPVRTATTYTPQFLGLPKGVWPRVGGYETAGEGIVIGFIDTGIDPTHSSFADDVSDHTYPVPDHFSGICEVTRDFPSGSCNRKLVGARHFAASAITRGVFNSSQDYASPLDGDGHGTHTASVAAGNHGIPVMVAGHYFGNASGMAPRSHIAVYKALYKSFGGFAADVVAAIDQAAQDGVDIISLSITPNRRPPGIATFFNPIDMALLSAVKSGIFVVQAAGNTGPSPKSMSSFSPWIFTVGAASHDRVYSNSIVLGNNLTIPGVGLAPGTCSNEMYTLISAVHALSNETTLANDMYVGECQDPGNFDRELIQGNLLICSYSIRFVLGLSTVKQALQTAKNLSAAGVVFCMDPFVIGFQLNPTPLNMPGIIIPSTNDSKILLQYYNSSLERDGFTKKIVRFGAVASISGGLEANYSVSAPKVMYYSARGPDPEDGFLDNADIMKPNLVAPGNSIWAAWSTLGMESVEFQGESFAMMSGTSMAAPHIAGLAALIKQKFPHFSPAAIASALSTTASLYDKNSYEDYMSFLCGINGSIPIVFNYTGQNCQLYNSTVTAADLNLPSITIARLNRYQTVGRSLINIAGNETYRVDWTAPFGVSMNVTPSHFFIAMGEKQVLNITFNAMTNDSTASFGRIGLVGNGGHNLDIPLSVIVKLY
ncbi:hypothetical protein GOBAR_AA20044 [Gossypium barbadense]|uniref:Peptidase S8/S53 domain-containing protein n=1 Tax=Gossypium barbadense TaxID=3634 RepID=A0A2P5XBB7_GOSBA|nr:hypothetical protein GOBAR_AA20044 [Gossypium barbadense]